MRCLMGDSTKMIGHAPEINFSTAKIDEQVFLLNYGRHYTPILGEHATRDRFAELLLFRAWTTQFGYRVFIANPKASEKLIGETVNSLLHLGLPMFEQVHGYSPE